MNKIILNLDLRERLFTLNEGTIEALGRPRQVQILINMQEKMLVLRACGTEDIEAVVLPSEKTIATEIGARSIMKQIKQKMNWNDDRARECIGICYPEIKAVCFDLSKVRIIA